VLENEEMNFSEEEEMYRKKNPQLFMSIYIILMEKRGGRERMPHAQRPCGLSTHLTKCNIEIKS
jgi:hypothetical protein